MVKKLLNAVGVKHSSYQKDKKNKETLTNISVWTDEDIEAIEKVSKSMQKLTIREWLWI